MGTLQSVKPGYDCCVADRGAIISDGRGDVCSKVDLAQSPRDRNAGVKLTREGN